MSIRADFYAAGCGWAAGITKQRQKFQNRDAITTVES